MKGDWLHRHHRTSQQLSRTNSRSPYNGWLKCCRILIKMGIHALVPQTTMSYMTNSIRSIPKTHRKCWGGSTWFRTFRVHWIARWPNNFFHVCAKTTTSSITWHPQHTFLKFFYEKPITSQKQRNKCSAFRQATTERTWVTSFARHHTRQILTSSKN